VDVIPYPQSEDTYILQSEYPWKYHIITREQYDSFMKVLADSKGKTVDELTRTEEQAKNKEHMPAFKIAESTPGVHQVNIRFLSHLLSSLPTL
jgi:hypothetical protein